MEKLRAKTQYQLTICYVGFSGLVTPKIVNRLLVAEGFEAKQGQIIDASIVPVPIQRNPREANRRIKNGEVPQDWGDAKRAQKDVDGRWTGKRGKKYFGYKNHLSIDAKHKLILRFETTPANVHDSRVFDDLIDPDNVDPGVWADSAYRSQDTEKVLQDAGYESHILRERSAQPTAHGRTTGKQSHARQDSLPRRACLRLPGEQHGWELHPHHWFGSGQAQDRLDEPDLQSDALPATHQR